MQTGPQEILGPQDLNKIGQLENSRKYNNQFLQEQLSQMNSEIEDVLDKDDQNPGNQVLDNLDSNVELTENGQDPTSGK